MMKGWLPLVVGLSLVGCIPWFVPREDSHQIIADSAAWCWFADPRAVVYKGRTYVGWVNDAGDIQVGAYDGHAQEWNITTLHPALQVDDHANPALLVLPAGRLMAFYSPHSGAPMYYRITERPGDISSWTEARELGVNTEGRHGYTYPNPVLLSGEENRIYLFWRGANYKPSFSTSDDGGKTWSAALTLIEGRGARPYVKYVTDGDRRIHFAFTDGHPRKELANSIYYAFYENGAFYQADDTLIRTMADLPFDPAEAHLVYDGLRPEGRAWIWDIALDHEGQPVIVYTALPLETDHRYRYARWTGGRWLDREVVAAGGWFPQTLEGVKERETYYSGGIYLDHQDPSVVYLSRPVRGVFEIEKWTTTDGGAIWTSEAVTAGSLKNNIRPVVPHGDRQNGPDLIWMHGDYTHYTEFQTQLKMKPAGRED
ncbi:MAG: BNR-4 repeat-containing protein [Fidelibacterota bacterium]|nr:MAG: BNR-4 repeat-containing protein [Candidatus Neomarinimicrobiota bacterium]